MSLRGLDEFVTGNWGEDYWKDEPYHSDGPWVCDFCRLGACHACHGKDCDCPNRIGRTAKTHGPYLGPLKLVVDQPKKTVPSFLRRNEEALTLDDGEELTLNDGTHS